MIANKNSSSSDDRAVNHSKTDEFKCFLMIRSLMEEKNHPWPTLSDMPWLHKMMQNDAFSPIFRMLDDMSETEEKTRCMARLENMFSMSGLDMPIILEKWLLSYTV